MQSNKAHQFEVGDDSRPKETTPKFSQIGPRVQKQSISARHSFPSSKKWLIKPGWRNAKCLKLGDTSYDENGRFLSPEEFDRSMNLAQRFFLSYHNLNKWALSKGLLLFNIVFKFHSFMHMVENGVHMNPKESMNFRSEDFVGQLARLGHSCSMGVRSTKLSSKIIPKYLVLLHFQLTRPGFNTKSSLDD